MKWFVLLCGLLISHRSLIGAEIVVGTTRLFVPAPEGYTLITSNMQPFAEFSERFVPPVNEQFALFLPEAEAIAAARGEIPQSERKFYVQTSKKLVHSFMSSADFAELKRAIKTQNADALKKAEREMPGFLQKVNEGFAQDYNVNLNLAVDQMVPLPPHYETERGLAYSMFLKFKANDESGKPRIFEGAATATFVHLQGKVLFLYVNAEKSGLQWCRDESERWADAIIAGNPSTGEVAAREKRSSRSGFNWSRVLRHALIGAGVGGIVAALSVLRKRKQNNTGQS